MIIKDIFKQLFSSHTSDHSLVEKLWNEIETSYSNRLNSIGVSVDKINKCEEQILATKTHEDTNDYDTNLFTDADLSILGQTWNMYENYTHQLRKEYAVYPDLLYNERRKKVLMHFLEMNRIFKTDEFYNQFEKQARENLKRELKEL